MNTRDVDFTPEQTRMLERVRVQQGFTSLHAAAEWLVKENLRRKMGGGRGSRRALRLIVGGKSR
ncbi:MAG: hypothetical protein KBC94_07795 [Pseudacidovorax sp.]|uniref:hypothetical protein n=1 Tax=Pseudacidovorax sp. TaxID=1934311 RepID=UPI001B74B47A|nr:hypothetical protein [Pseudacidovorax sp.]MBP6894310.1 hypothetical protein [Pseudacidovorax sp.]